MQRIDIHLPILIPKILYRLGVFILLKYRRLRYGYPFRLIRLGPGQYSKVDPEDYEWLSIYNWHLLTGPTNRYAVRVDRKRLFVHMHREIMKPPKGMVVDHINRDGLDNRRANLRIATRQQNRCNSGPRLRRGTSKYKGVSWEESGALICPLTAKEFILADSIMKSRQPKPATQPRRNIMASSLGSISQTISLH